jgi:acetyl-CoA acetyltransferase
MLRPRRQLPFLNATAITGVGFTEFSRDSHRSVLSLADEACRAAISDAGLARADIDGIATFRVLEDSVPSQAVATSLGLPEVNYLIDLNLGGESPCYLVMLAAMAVQSGLARNVVVFRALNGRSGSKVGTAPFPGAATGFRYPIGFSAYPQFIAMWARRFMLATGATPEDHAAVPIAQRKYAALNERAARRTPISLDDYFQSPWLVEPFRTVDCTVEVDGACAVVVSSLDAAKDAPHPPVAITGAAYVAGRGSGLDMGDALLWPDCSYNYTSLLADDLWGSAGLQPADVDMAQIYDCFSSTVLMSMEGLGLAPRGGAGELIRSGATGAGGRLPVNTNGGLLCEGYIHGMNTVAEAVLQLQGRAGERTVEGAETCVVTSGALTDGSALVLARH